MRKSAVRADKAAVHSGDCESVYLYQGIYCFPQIARISLLAASSAGLNSQLFSSAANCSSIVDWGEKIFFEGLGSFCRGLFVWYS